MMTFQFVHNLFTTYTPAQADGKQINSQFSQANVHDKVLENGSTPSPPLWVCVCVYEEERVSKSVPHHRWLASNSEQREHIRFVHTVVGTGVFERSFPMAFQNVR